MSIKLPRYGITNASGGPVIQPDSTIEVEVKADTEVNTHPVEQGRFSGYNRVQKSVYIRLLLACQGKSMTRALFLSTLKKLKEGTQIVTVSLPDDSYPNMTLKSYGYRKEAERGAVTIWADTEWVEERSTNVVVSAPPATQPQGNEITNGGTLSSAFLTPQQLAAVNNPPIPPANLPSTYFFTAPPSGAAF